jgi:hypothetical protein
LSLTTRLIGNVGQVIEFFPNFELGEYEAADLKPFLVSAHKRLKQYNAPYVLLV